MSKRQLTESAQVAKLIKAELKKSGISCTAKSDNFSMGSSVDINLENQPPWVMDAIKAQTDKYEYGTFDSMTDCQGFKNRDFDGPQTKYLSINNHYTNEVHEAAKQFILARIEVEKFSDHDISRLTWEYLNGDSHLGCYFKKPHRILERLVISESQELAGGGVI